MNRRGQILLPGLAAFLMLLTAFFLTVTYARRELARARLQTAAIAASLSATRALATELNNAAAYNGFLNGFLMRWKNDAAMPLKNRKTFENWLKVNQGTMRAKSGYAYLNGAMGYPSAVGHLVARLNGAAISSPMGLLSTQLVAQDLRVWFLIPHVPFVVGPKVYRNVYFARKWGEDKRRAQPTHKVTWLVQGKGLRAAAASSVYLDVEPNNFLHNGGFPREHERSFLGNLGLQPFFPQFSARRVPASTLLSWVFR